jgi:hypothetical protein
VSVILGVAALVLIVIAVIYFVEPADKLPGFFPGHTAHGTKIRLKHGIAAAVVAAIALVGVWVTSGRKNTGSLPE